MCVGLNRHRLFGDLESQRVEELRLKRKHLFLSVQNLLLVFLQLRCDVPFRIGRRLFADVVGGNFVFVCVGDFDVIAEHIVEADFQGRDARPLTFGFLQLGDPGLTVEREVPQFVQFRVEAFLDHTTIRERHRRIRLDRRFNQCNNFGQRLQAIMDGVQRLGR